MLFCGGSIVPHCEHSLEKNGGMHLNKGWSALGKTIQKDLKGQQMAGGHGEKVGAHEVWLPQKTQIHFWCGLIPDKELEVIELQLPFYKSKSSQYKFNTIIVEIFWVNCNSHKQ